MPVTMINDSQRGRYVFYKAGGKVFKQWFGGNEVRTIQEISSFSQIMNAVSLRKWEINNKLNAGSNKPHLFDVTGNHFRPITLATPIFDYKSMFFGGTGQAVYVPDTDEHDFGTSNFTFTAWFSAQTTGTGELWDKLHDAFSSSNGYSVVLSAANLETAGASMSIKYPNSTFNTINCPTTDISNKWNLVVISVSRASFGIGFLNGVSGATTSLGANKNFSLENSLGAYIGNAHNLSRDVRIYIDEVALWSGAWGATEVNELWNSGNGLAASAHSASANTVSYYRMGEDVSFPTVPDSAGSSPGTMTGMTSSNLSTQGIV